MMRDRLRREDLSAPIRVAVQHQRTGYCVPVCQRRKAFRDRPNRHEQKFVAVLRHRIADGSARIVENHDKARGSGRQRIAQPTDRMV